MTFDERLELARRVRAHVLASTVPAWFADQANAAARDAGDLVREMGVTLGWHTADPSEVDADEGAARTLAALLDCQPCVHLRRDGPQPAVARLALRRVECIRCSHIARRPPPGEDDRCDWCGKRDIKWFQPAAIQLGMTIAVGDRCRDCGIATAPRRVA